MLRGDHHVMDQRQAQDQIGLAAVVERFPFPAAPALGPADTLLSCITSGVTLSGVSVFTP
jgi:hypothetical protein